MKSGAQRQAKYRKAHARLDMVVSTGTQRALQRMSRQTGLSLRECVETSVASPPLSAYLGANSIDRLEFLAQAANQSPKVYLAKLLRQLIRERPARPTLELTATEVQDVPRDLLLDQ